MALATPSLLGLARQSLPLGEIRGGASREVEGKRGRQPLRLENFRFTTPSQDTAGAVAERFGGDPAPWDRRRGYWVVDTLVSKVDVWVPPRGLAVDTLMEMWGGTPAKCLRRCDGRTERRSGQPCMCPMPSDPDDPDDVQRAYDERQRLAKSTPPQACSVRTRYNLTIPYLPGLSGVWKLLTGSANAARWSADCGEVLERARAASVFLPASLEITWWPGQDGHPYPVPILRLKQSAAQVAAGELPSGLEGLLTQLQTGGEPRRALTAGTGESSPSTAQAETAAPTSPPARTPARRESRGRPPRRKAQDIADDARNATTRYDVEALVKEAGAAGFSQDHIIGDPDEPNISEELLPYLRQRWRDLPAGDAMRVPA